MKVILGLMIFTSLFLMSSLESSAQKPPSAAQTVERLHTQYHDLQLKEASLRERLVELIEELKPENIEHSLAGVGSTRPEELRAQRRRVLENEKSSIESQLKEIDRTRERLTADIRTAESAAYQESARVVDSDGSQAQGSIVANAGGFPRWGLFVVAGAIMLIGIVVLVSLVRRR